MLEVAVVCAVAETVEESEDETVFAARGDKVPIWLRLDVCD